MRYSPAVRSRRLVLGCFKFAFFSYTIQFPAANIYRFTLLGLLFIVSLASCAHRQNIQKLSDKPTLSLRRLPPTCDTVDRSNEELKIETFSALTAPTGHQDSAAVRPSNHIGPETALRPATSQDIEPSPDGYYLSELIDLGLRYNPSTRVRWAAVRASAAA